VILLYELKNGVIYQGDVMNTLTNEIDDNSIDLVCTSPPYNVGIDYGTMVDDKKKWEEYWSWMEDIIKILYKKLKVGGRVCWNVQINVRRKDEVRVNFMQKFKNIFDKIGYVDMGDILWVEATMTKLTAWGSWMSASSPYIQMPAECVLVYAKGSTKKEPVGVSDISKEDFMKWVTGMWNFPNPSQGIEHPAPFPPELPKRCIKLFSYVGDTVLDPFSGSGTTLMVANENNRKFIGIDINEDFVNYSLKRITGQNNVAEGFELPPKEGLDGLW
jgi:site-specific DNA-methyltransferase (adenine-specific)